MPAVGLGHPQRSLPTLKPGIYDDPVTSSDGISSVYQFKISCGYTDQIKMVLWVQNPNNKKWMQHYRQCVSYFNLIAPPDIKEFVSITCFEKIALDRYVTSRSLRKSICYQTAIKYHQLCQLAYDLQTQTRSKIAIERHLLNVLITLSYLQVKK